ncbi:hypothetical protein SAMN04488540_11887 [Ferrimonas sediminum]|uniref:Uncharacterized protein n=1 Tax=Ferrimonas sediminum TaxID=718193 RepID=A0A1G8YZJ0_9GAMM|nr:hypothetical protein [Ferrimonas sediminum]SDK08272.1 hypothetical protein SAMN04488540_11887 [Ferrimonas sediminum]
MLKYIFSSFSLTALTFSVVIFSSVHLEVDSFSKVAYLLYFVPVVLEVCLMGQHYGILKGGISSDGSVNKLDRRKLSLGLLVCFLITFYFYESDGLSCLFVFLSCLAFTCLRFAAAYFRVLGMPTLAVFSERSVQLSVSFIFILALIYGLDNFYLELALLFVAALFFILTMNFNPKCSVLKNSSWVARTDTIYELNMLVTIGSMLLVRSIDKLLVSSFFESVDFAKFVILFQMYLPFPIVAGVIFQYYMPILSKKRLVSFKKKFVTPVVIVSIACWFVFSKLAFIICDFIYDGKYQFTNIEVNLIIAAGILYILYQPFALVIVSVANNKQLLSLNLLNIIPIVIYLVLIALGSDKGSLLFVVSGFLLFWITKLIIGISLTVRVEKFRWV